MAATDGSFSTSVISARSTTSNQIPLVVFVASEFSCTFTLSSIQLVYGVLDLVSTLVLYVCDCTLFVVRSSFL